MTRVADKVPVEELEIDRIRSKAIRGTETAGPGGREESGLCRALRCGEKAEALGNGRLADQQVCTGSRGDVRSAQSAVRQYVRSLVTLGTHAAKDRARKRPVTCGNRVWAPGLKLADKAERPVVEKVSNEGATEDSLGIQDHTEVTLVADVVLRQGPISPDVPWIARFGDAEEVFRRGQKFRQGVARLELEVVR